MKKLASFCAGVCLIASGSAVFAQDMQPGPPKVLLIEREYTKPGKAGMIHQKSESQFVAAMAAAKWPTHYFAATSMSGPSRALFFVGYSSFEAWEADKNATLTAAIDRITMSDGELLTEFDQSVFVFDPDLSLHTRDVAHDRYFDITTFHVKPGHAKEFEDLAKMYVEGMGKISEKANWATYESYYGADNGGVYIAISAMATLADDDTGMMDDKKFADAMGPEKMKTIRNLTESSIASESTNLFSFDPKMSYAWDSWVKADSYWKPKAAAMAKKPAPANP
jgi:hypothetical protein